MYKKIIKGIIREFYNITGKENVFFDENTKENYSHDENREIKILPELVIKPTNKKQISEIMKLANKERIPVTPRGAGTGRSGGAVPLYGGIVLSLEKMNKIIEIDKNNIMAVVEPGVITGELQTKVEEINLFYPPDPASLETCTIGGNAATNAGGARAVKYGVTKDYVCGVETVLPTGGIASFGGKLTKISTGYNFTQLLVGSEGTLAIITKIILKLLPSPRFKIDLLIPFTSLKEATKSLVEITLNKKIIPTAVEFLDNKSIKIAEIYLKREHPFSNAKAQLFIELDGDNKDELIDEANELHEICIKNNAKEIIVAEDKMQQDRLWEARRCLSEAIKTISAIYETSDVVVPRSEIPLFCEKLEELADKYQLEILYFGHAGDGNIHIHILKKDTANSIWFKKSKELQKEIYKLAVGIGGTVSGEHGIGALKKEYLPLAFSQKQIELMGNIKKSFDQNCILNPGKII